MVFGATLAEDVEQVGVPRRQGPACHLQVVITEGNRLCLLPLVVKHVDGGLSQRSDMLEERKQRFYSVYQKYCTNLLEKNPF